MADAIATNAPGRSPTASQARAPNGSLQANRAATGRTQMGRTQTGRIQRLRVAGLLGFIGLMPVLAIPAVNRQVDRLLFASTSERLDERLARVRAGGTADTKFAGTSPSIESALTKTSSDTSRRRLAAGDEDDTGGVRRLPPVEPALANLDFDAVQRRLQSLGATYYRLEDLGDEPRRYRFRCEVPLPGSENYLRPFEADDDDPSVAMHTVLGDVERWLDEHRRTVEKKRARPAFENPR